MKSIVSTEETHAATTTSFSRMRGHTLDIIDILRDNGSLTSSQVGDLIGKRCDFVNVYLKRLTNYGIAVKNEEFWCLTDFGRYLISLLYRDRDRDRENTSRTQVEHKKNTSSEKKPFQVSIQAWLRESNPGEAEKVVVDILITHFNRTGSKFLLVKDHYAMSDMLSINVSDVGDVLAKLRQENIIYLMRDPTSGMWKLGLKKAFIEALQKQK